MESLSGVRKTLNSLLIEASFHDVAAHSQGSANIYRVFNATSEILNRDHVVLGRQQSAWEVAQLEVFCSLEIVENALCGVALPAAKDQLPAFSNRVAPFPLGTLGSTNGDQVLQNFRDHSLSLLHIQGEPAVFALEVFLDSLLEKRGTAILPYFVGFIHFFSSISLEQNHQTLHNTAAVLDTKKTITHSPNKHEENILITSALPYVNNVPHLGNLIGSVLSADCFARYCKIREINTLFVCGTDEYGTATETKAMEESCSPQELCDKYHKLHREVYEWFNIDFDYFGRTTTPEQTTICQNIFNQLHLRGLISEKSVTQLYCEQHDGFLADRFVEGGCPRPGCGYEDARGDQCDKCGHLMDPLELVDPKCKLDKSSPVVRDSKHFFLRLDSLQEDVSSWINSASSNGDWSRNARVISENWLKEGLKPRCITRDLKWGVPVPSDYPGFADKVFYVWFDAPIGYVSITANYTKDWAQWWYNPQHVKLYHFIGKDNVPFHSVVFPACQMGTADSWTMAHHISTTEYLQYETGKFSKSRGIGVFGNNAKDSGIPVDVWRYYLLASRPETSDTQFLWKDLVARNNTELLGNLGNLVNRVIKFTTAKYSGYVPFYIADDNTQFGTFKNDISVLISEYNEYFSSVKLRAAIERAMRISTRCNQFLQENQLGNKLFDEEAGRCATVIGLSLNCLYLLSALVFPYMPGTSVSMTNQLGMPQRRLPLSWSEDIFPGHRIGKQEYLFHKIDEAKIEEWKLLYGGNKQN